MLTDKNILFSGNMVSAFWSTKQHCVNTEKHNGLFWASNIYFIAWILESYSLLECLHDSLVGLVVLSSSGHQGSWQRR